MSKTDKDFDNFLSSKFSSFFSLWSILFAVVKVKSFWLEFHFNNNKKNFEFEKIKMVPVQRYCWQKSKKDPRISPQVKKLKKKYFFVSSNIWSSNTIFQFEETQTDWQFGPWRLCLAVVARNILVCFVWSITRFFIDEIIFYKSLIFIE